MPDNHPPTVRRSLRTAIWFTFAPLCMLLGGGAAAQYVMAHEVHHDVQRLFEELREVGLCRTLTDELAGVAQWVGAAPQATASSDALVMADVRAHHAAARATLARFVVDGDPSPADHDGIEAKLLRRLATALAAGEDLLDRGSALGALAPTVQVAQHDASALAATIETETRTLGDQLEQRSGAMGGLLLLLSGASLATLGTLAWLLSRRVLQPVAALRAAAVRLGRGERDVVVPTRHADELGDLAVTFDRMAARLRQSHDDLEQRVEARSREVLRTAQLAQLGTVAAGIAHEINNPLASIVACADGLLRELDGPADRRGDPREYLQILQREAMRARDITMRLLRFARDDEPRCEPVHLAHEATEVGALFAHQLADAGVRLQLVGAADCPPVLGDAAAWRQVWFNLLRNALDASPRGGTITVGFDRVDDELCCRVEDDGPGVPTALQDRVFEPYFTTKSPGSGTGLGLAIVHRIVTAHRGRIECQRGHRGARFLIHVPLAPSS